MSAWKDWLWWIVSTVFDPSVLTSVAEQFLSWVAGNVGAALGDTYGQPFTFISDFLASGPLGALMSLVFYFAGVVMYVSYLRVCISLVIMATIVAALIRVVVWASSLFWTKPT